VDEAVAASSDVTFALRQTHKLLQTEVQRSHFAQEILQQSSDAIKQLGESYRGLDKLLEDSKSLIGTLFASNKSDTWYLETAIYILIGTIAWLVFRRLIYGPAWWLIWLPVKFTYKTLVIVFGLTKSKALVERDLGVTTSADIGTTPIPSASVSMAGEQDQKVQQPETGESQTPMADEVTKQVGEVKEEITRGDGTKLKHSDQPRNPMKRMFEADVGNKGKKEKDEL